MVENIFINVALIKEQGHPSFFIINLKFKIQPLWLKKISRFI